MTSLKETGPSSLETALNRAIEAIPPMWPLDATVAVNPFLGSHGASLGVADARFAAMTGSSLLMPREWFAEKIASGDITADDIRAAIQSVAPASGLTAEQVRPMLERDPGSNARIPTIADLAGRHAGLDIAAILTDRLTAWAANHFDTGQALWQVNDRGTIWSSWREFASNDLTPEVLGLDGFCRFASRLPDDADAFLAMAVGELGLPGESLEAYLTQRLFDLGGWAQLGRYQLWQAEMTGGQDPVMRHLAAIALAFDLFLYRAYGSEIGPDWERACLQRQTVAADDEATRLSDILQFALDHAEQRRLAALVNSPDRETGEAKRPAIQAAFCIDVRSEVYRRALESVSGSVETLGFAGFFGLGIRHRAFASDVDENRLPVLLNPSAGTVETTQDTHGADRAKRIRLRAVRAWGRFKLAAVSSFAFVESAGPIYVPKLMQGALGLKGAGKKVGPVPVFTAEMTAEAKLDAAETILRAMSLTSNFARLVLLVGHGASVTNNPHASALQCGACGGHAGDVNARLLAGLLNDKAVRAGLAGRGLPIPEDTHFVGALHDTTADTVTLFDDQPSSTHQGDLKAATLLLDEAGDRARAERAPAFRGTKHPQRLRKRGRSWSQTRPEWGLAGCSAFIAAPRSRTARADLGGRSFLHSYEWQGDKDFKVLELILTAPVVVASWISLQYYGSTVAPGLFGAGNKLLHNVIGGIGVLEGNGGSLRSGLPFQSVHDGIGSRHLPVRLSVCVEAPREAITGVLDAHPGVKSLFDNRWLHLFALNEAGELAWRYAGDGQWTQAFSGNEQPAYAEKAA